MKKIVVSQRVRDEIASPAPVGQRHKQLVRLVMDLMEAGFIADAIFLQLRSMYAKDVSDSEIRSVIAWMKAQSEETGEGAENRDAVPATSSMRLIAPDSKTTIRRVEDWLKGFSCSEACLSEISPWRPLEDWRFDGSMLIAGLYDVDDCVNVVVDHTTDPDDPQKARPKGPGMTLRRDDWLRKIRESGPPESAAGAWIRPNPVVASGRGIGGAFTDADVTNHRFLLIESDILPADLQLSAIGMLRLPVAAVIASGGRSYHAWVRIDAPDGKIYREIARRIFGTLVQFGFDSQNANPSRLSRFPGALRRIGAEADGRQRLIYLNPDAGGNRPIFNHV